MRINKILFIFFIIINHAFATTDLSKVEFKFLNAIEADEFLSTKDDYINNLSVLDLSLYHSTKETITISEHLNFLKTTARDWSEEERKSILEKLNTFKQVALKLELKINLPDEVLLIKTNGEDAFNSHYTRRNAIIFPSTSLNGMTTDLATVYHELFHIMSRNNPALTDALYLICHFKRIPRLKYSDDFEKIRTTNPDAFFYEHAVEVTFLNQKIEVVPVMFSAIKQEEITGPVVESQIYRLGLFEKNTFNQDERVVLKTSETNYKEIVMANTHYYIHPEEIMAENFKLLLLQNTPNEEMPTIKYQIPITQLLHLLKIQ